MLICRQTNPQTNKIVAEALNEAVNVHNMKKVRVNAQVKAMVSFIEGFVNILYIVIISFTVRTSLGTLVMQSVTYMIILPYISLMNTSYNKDRVIENGWKNVLKNLWVKESSVRCLNDTPKCIQNNMHVQKRMEIPSKNMTPNSSNGSFKTSSSGQNFGRKIAWPEEEIGSELPASTSQGQFSESKIQTIVSKKNDEPEKENTNESSVVDKIILKMIQHTHEEHEYIRYFEQLIDHLSNSKESQKYTNEKCRDDELPNFIPDIVYQHRPQRCKGKRSKSSVIASNKQTKSKILLDANHLLIKDMRTSFDSNENERKLFRENILNEIQSCNIDSDMKNVLIEKLIDKEESYLI